jgi:SulP family sulfate permease
MIPVDVLAFIPRLFFGAVLTFVALDLMLDWLVFQYKRVHIIEFLVIWATFIAINLTGT